MGLLLSILVFSVGVLEALACVRHIQQGILPAWAPRHVTTTSGRRLLRERWRKSTSRDEGGEIPVEVAGELPPTPTSAPSRGRPAPLQLQERAGSPVLHRARTPDIHWPEPVPHSPARNVEQTLPSPVEEVPGDLAWPPGDVLASRRRTSVTETLPPVEHSQAVPLAPGSPVPPAEFARETQEPRRCKPAKASSFEEARVEPPFQAPAPAFPEVTSAPRQPDVINLSYEDYSAAGPRAAVVGRIQITATKEPSGDEEPAPWPIVNIDTLVTSDEEGDITPPANSGSRRVSFDPTPTVVSFDKEKPVAAEKKLKSPAASTPTVKITHDLEDILREQMPAFIDQVIQEALLKASDVLSLRDRGGPVNGVSLFLTDVISNGVMGNENGEEYKDNFESKEEGATGVGDNIYSIMEKLKRGENLDDSTQPINNLQKQTIEQECTSTTFSVPSEKEPSENGTVLESQLQSEEQFNTLQLNKVEDIETLHSDNLALEDKYSEAVSQPTADCQREEVIENKSDQSIEVNNSECLPTNIHGTNGEELKVESQHMSYSEEQLLQNVYPQENYDADDKSSQFEIEDQLLNEPVSYSNEEESLETISQQRQTEPDTIPKNSVHPDEKVCSITKEVSEDNATSPPTPTSTTLEAIASSAPLTENNGPEEAKEARTLAKQVSPGSQGALDQTQNTRASAATDSAETRISSDEPHEFDIEPGSLASPDVRSTPQPPDEQSAPPPCEELSPASREELVPSKGRTQDTPSAATAAPPPSPPPSPPPQLAPAPTTDKQQQATDSTPSADRNETSRTKEKKKKHILRKRSSKEKRGKRVQTPQASRSASEDEEEAPESATSAPSDAPPPPPARATRESPTPTPAPLPAQPEPEDSARELTLGTSSSSTTSSSGGASAARPTTPAAAPQPEAFWLIFSGEYTKAMNKDWHSGHFCCWQCDESLTGQRYVLRDDHPYCIKCYESVFANMCEECNRTIGIDSKDLSYKDKHWHEACFLCTKCRVSLVDKQFGSKADKIYCGNCYDAQFASRCDGCGEIFRAGTKKMEYKTRQWHEKCFCCCVCKTAIGTKSFIPREQEIYCAGCYEEKFATRCVKCNKIITSGGVTYKNEPWHRECFTCTHCNTSLAGQRFTSRDEKPYCADCFGELFAKRCTACSKPITGIGGTRFISFEDRHWHNDCFICASCKTSLVGRGFITDADDIICPECAKQKLM